MLEHHYEVTVTWTGNDGDGTSTYRSYRRDHDVDAPGRPTIAASADRAFHGDRTRWNPEQLVVAALSECHLLTYLHRCADSGVVVESYVDDASGTMTMNRDGSGQITAVTLRPRVTVRDQPMVPTALALHDEVPALCFVARSVNFPVHHEPEVTAAAG